MEPNQNTEVNSLENPETNVDGGATSVSTSPSSDASQTTGALGQTPEAPTSGIPPVKPSLSKRIRALISGVNIYLLLFVLIIVLASGIVFVGYQKTKKQSSQTKVNTQDLDQATLDQLNGTETKVGDPKQLLSVESNAVFAGKVLIRDSLDVAGAIKVGGSLTLPGITVSGTSNFDQILANKLSIAGDTSIQGGVIIQKNLSVTGGATFGGAISAPQLTIQTLALNNDIQLNRHIDAGGATPSQSNLNLGSGGTASISGTDTAGTVNINIGGGNPSGCYVAVNFSQKFNSAPHVVITPIGAAGAGLNYYVDSRTSTSFRICSTSGAGTGTYIFDYVVID